MRRRNFVQSSSVGFLTHVHKNAIIGRISGRAHLHTNLMLSADGSNVIKWSIDAAFAVHPDFKSHSGGTMTMGKGAAQSGSKKQKVNTRSSTEAELVRSDDMITQILWTNLFLKAQAYNIKDMVSLMQIALLLFPLSWFHHCDS